MYINSTAPQRFWSKVDKSAGPGSCWPWTGAMDKRGRGKFELGPKMCATSYRVAYRLHYEVEPGALYVCHKCDNPKCCNPTHLFLGTHLDNMADMTAKGRRLGRQAPNNKGAANPRAKLTEDDVREIRRLSKNGKMLRELAVAYSVSIPTIAAIRSGRNWSHVK
jgi:hypothetical protein